jgi:ribosomal protein S21
MACVRARVELRDLPANPTTQDKAFAFKKMFASFKKQVADAGILQLYKQHEYYESPGEKRRRKQKESRNQRMKQKLRENFPERRSNRGSND